MFYVFFRGVLIKNYMTIPLGRTKKLLRHVEHNIKNKYGMMFLVFTENSENVKIMAFKGVVMERIILQSS